MVLRLAAAAAAAAAAVQHKGSNCKDARKFACMWVCIGGVTACSLHAHVQCTHWHVQCRDASLHNTEHTTHLQVLREGLLWGGQGREAP
eukprot:1156955-Pelagomonas_calceolata.AAC.2